MNASWKQPSILPGFKLTLGYTLLYLALIVLIPLSGLFVSTATMGWESFWVKISSPRVLAALRLTFGTAAIAAAINTVFGLLLAWVLVRYRFPGKKLMDALIDLPFALPTAVAGIALTTLYASNGWFGAPLEELGIKVAYTPVGIVVALCFVGMPFAVRMVEPVLKDFDPQLEEAAASLGATRLQVFLRVILPELVPAILTGFALCFARGLGEYGSLVFIAGNVPMVSEIAPLLLVISLEQYDVAGATAVAVVMLLASFLLLYAINLLQKWARRA